MREDGYVAFNGFFGKELTKPVLEEVIALEKERSKKCKGGLEVNLHTGMELNGPLDPVCEERWRTLGQGTAFGAMYASPNLQHMLQGLLEACGDVEVPDFISFQLSWVRGKRKGDATEVHIDYYDIEEDILSEDVSKSYNVWTRLSDSPRDSSMLAVCPGSHKLDFGPARQGRGIPDSLRAKILAGKQQWHMFRNTLNTAGTVVVMSLRLAHGATPNESPKEVRFSWDIRFRAQVKDPRDVVYGARGEDPPHWAQCLHWTRGCHLQHPHVAPYVRSMLLVNARLRAEGQPWLLPDLLNVVLFHLARIITPRWIPHEQVFPRRLERRATGVFRPDLEWEGTGSSPFDSGGEDLPFPRNLELESTGVEESSE